MATGHRRRNYSLGIVWHVGAHLTGVLILGLARVRPETVVTGLRRGLFAYFLLASLEVLLSRYHKWAFTPLEPQPRRFALVTGATAGLGREIAYQLAEKKYSLLLVGRTEPILTRMRAEMELVHKPIDVELCVCDLATPAGRTALADCIRDKNLVIDILVNAAGSAPPPKNFAQLSVDEVDELVRVNVMTMTQVTHALLPQMTKRGVGRILNLSTLASASASPSEAILGASRAYVTSLSQALNYELRATGVTVTCFHAGPLEVNLEDPAVHKTELTLGERWPWVTHPKDCAKMAIDALLQADDVAYDSYLHQFLGFLLRAFVPARLGHALIAMLWQPMHKALTVLRR